MAQPQAHSRVKSNGGQYGAAAEARTMARPWVERGARLGYLAKGIVYLLVGGIAARAAIGRGEVEDSRGALAFLVDRPFGKVVLGVVALGLLGYAVWQAIRALVDPERRGTDAKGLGARAYALVSGLVHATLAMAAFRLLGGDRSAEQDSTRSWTAELMTQPMGRWLVAAVGLAVLGLAAYQFLQAAGGGWRRHIRVDRLEPTVARWLGPVARLGLAARGTVFLIIGGFFVVAALRARPEEAKGVGDALATLAAQPFGSMLLLVVALGLCAYGLYELVKARFRVIATP